MAINSITTEIVTDYGNYYESFLCIRHALTSF
jgi:hypothetical protein